MGSELIITADVIDRDVVLTPSGEIDYDTASQLREIAHAAAIAGVHRNVIVDLRAILVIDSSGLAALIKARKAAEGADTGFYVQVTPHSPPERILAASNLIGYLNVIHDVSEI